MPEQAGWCASPSHPANRPLPESATSVPARHVEEIAASTAPRLTDKDARDAELRHEWDPFPNRLDADLDSDKAFLLKKIFGSVLAGNEFYRAPNGGKQHIPTLRGVKLSPHNSGTKQRSAAQKWVISMYDAWCQSSTRSIIFRTIQYPETSPLAWVVSGIVVIAILASTVTFCMETVPQWENSTVLAIIDYVCIGIFTLDYVTRLICCPNLKDFFFNMFNFIDICAILPFWIELFVSGPGYGQSDQTRILRVLRLVRVVRLLRIFPLFFNMSLVIDALVLSYGAIIMLCFMLLIMLLVFASIIYYIENSVPDSMFYSIPQAMYFIQTTLTTTGYGDIVPTTAWGKFATGCMMISAIIILALPITVLGSNFSTIWSRSKRKRRAAEKSPLIWSNLKYMMEMMQQQHAAIDDILSLFEELQGTIERDVFAVRELAQEARLIYLARAAKGKTEGWEQDMSALHQLLLSMREHISNARDKYVEVEGLVELSKIAKGHNYLERLTCMQEAYKHLHNLFTEGANAIREVRSLADDVIWEVDHSDTPTIWS